MSNIDHMKITSKQYAAGRLTPVKPVCQSLLYIYTKIKDRYHGVCGRTLKLKGNENVFYKRKTKIKEIISHFRKNNLLLAK